jgi:alkylated DNA repair dioxygenase AlkB
MHPHPFPERMNKLKIAVEKLAGVAFTSCLLNLYRDGNDSNGWHADNEKELGQNPVIASLSLGETRKFKMKHRRDKSLKYDLDLVSGSLLIMKGGTQHHWLHQVPKTKRPVGERINLTFRRIS